MPYHHNTVSEHKLRKRTICLCSVKTILLINQLLTYLYELLHICNKFFPLIHPLTNFLNHSQQ